MLQRFIERRKLLTIFISTAHNSAALALDLISLILSKENPSVASMTLRGELQAMVGLGKLGTQKHAESALTPEKKQELSAVTNGWNVLAIDEITDSTISAAAALEKEVDREGKYWEDVLSIREGGWSMCRMPRERQTLGVRFGFNEGMSLVPSIFPRLSVISWYRSVNRACSQQTRSSET